MAQSLPNGWTPRASEHPATRAASHQRPGGHRTAGALPGGPWPRLLVFLCIDGDRELLGDVGVPFLEIGSQPLVGEIERVRVLPVMLHDVVQPLGDVIVVHGNRQFAPVVETTRGEVDRAYDRPRAVGEAHLRVQLEML